IRLNGPEFFCEKTSSNRGPCHSAMRHGFAGGRIQYVSGFLSQLIIRAGPDEAVFERQEWRGPRCKSQRYPPAWRLATDIGFRVARRSEPLHLGARRLGWDL